MRAIFLALACLLFSTGAFAQKPYTFSPSGPVTLVTGNGYAKTQIISIKNEGNTTLYLNISFTGDSALQLYYPATITLWPDSSRTLNVVYYSSQTDTSYGFVRISDSVHTADTIQFTGIDTGSVFKPWEIGSFVAHAGNYYSRGDTVRIPIKNNLNDSCFITASMLNDSYGFSAIGSQQRGIAANGTSYFEYLYQSSSYTSAYAQVRFQGEGISNLAGFDGMTQTTPPDSLRVQAKMDFGSIPTGDTLCRTLTIYNPSDSAAYLTSLTILQNSRFFFSDLPALPVAINAYDSITITVCFVAPETGGTNANSYMNINYSFGNVQRGTTIYLHGSSLGCYSVSTEDLNFGGVTRDDVVSQTFSIINDRDATTEVALSINPGNSGFAIMTSSPVSIAPDDTASVEVQFTASGSTYHAAKLVIDGSDNCGQREVTLMGYIDTSTFVDTNAMALYANEERMLNFVGDSSNSTKLYTFYNNQHDPVKIVSVGLKVGTHFTITDIDPSNPEFTLDSGEVMGVTVQFDETPGTYTDTLVIVTEDGIIAISFPMHAVIQGTADVATPSFSTARMTVSPNPSSGPVTITVTDATTASLEVLDIMGKRIERFDGTVSTLDRNELSAGTYFVRASGVGIDRKPFVITTRIVIK